MSKWIELTDEDRERAFNSLPDMRYGFLKKWGWLHFAKAVEASCREKNATPSPAWCASVDAELAATAEVDTKAAALRDLLFQLDLQAGNGMIPWEIEDAYAAYSNAANSILPTLPATAVAEGAQLDGESLEPLRMSAALRRVRVRTKEWVQPVLGIPGHYKPMPVRCALFHCWGSEFEEFEAGPANRTTAIVEFSDGSVEAVLPHEIKFEVDL